MSDVEDDSQGRMRPMCDWLTKINLQVITPRRVVRIGLTNKEINITSLSLQTGVIIKKTTAFNTKLLHTETKLINDVSYGWCDAQPTQVEVSGSQNRARLLFRSAS